MMATSSRDIASLTRVYKQSLNYVNIIKCNGRLFEIDTLCYFRKMRGHTSFILINIIKRKFIFYLRDIWLIRK